jgi:hypothetical protein
MDVAHKDATSVVHDIQQDAFVVERARELLTHWFEVSAADGEHLLRSWSRQTRTPLHSLAAALTSDIFEGRPSGCAPKVLRHLEQSLRQLPGTGIERLKPVARTGERDDGTSHHPGANCVAR